MEELTKSVNSLSDKPFFGYYITILRDPLWARRRRLREDRYCLEDFFRLLQSCRQKSYNRRGNHSKGILR